MVKQKRELKRKIVRKYDENEIKDFDFVKESDGPLKKTVGFLGFLIVSAILLATIWVFIVMFLIVFNAQ